MFGVGCGPSSVSVVGGADIGVSLGAGLFGCDGGAVGTGVLAPPAAGCSIVGVGVGTNTMRTPAGVGSGALGGGGTIATIPVGTAPTRIGVGVTVKASSAVERSAAIASGTSGANGGSSNPSLHGL